MSVWAYGKKDLFIHQKTKDFYQIIDLAKNKGFSTKTPNFKKNAYFFRTFLKPVTSKVFVVEKRARYEKYAPIYKLLDNIRHVVSK